MKCPAKSFKAIFAASFVFLAMIGIVGPAYGASQSQFVYAAANNSTGSGTVLGYAVNSTTGALSLVPGSPFAAGLEPTALALTPSNKFLYVANSGSGTISAYTVDGTTGALTKVNGSPFASRVGARTVAIDPSGKFVYVGCDSSGTDLWGYTIDQTTGALTPVPGSPYYTAPISYETGWNAWAVAVDRSGKFLYVATELGPVLTYKINSGTGALTQVSSSNYGPGAQPSFMGVDPSGKFVYVTGMRDVFAYTTDSTTGALTPVSGSPFESGFPYEQTLGIDPLDRFVYTANSNPNGLGAYTINRTTGALTPIPGSPFAWTTAPAFGSMAIDPSGKFAYIPEGSNSSYGIAAFTINGTNGTLAPISGSPFSVGAILEALAITNAVSSTPFEKFEAKVYIDEDRKTSFRAEGFFSLSEGNSGIDPFTQSVELQVGTYTVTIPAGSFKEKGKHDFDRDRDRKEQEFEFKGEIDGVDLTVRIEQMKKNEYIFTAEGRGDILQGIKNPVAVALAIGNYEGSTSVKADIDK
jgi:6-phosphogluconolactonase